MLLFLVIIVYCPSLSIFLSVLTAILRWTWVSRCLLKQRMMEVVSGDNWSYRSCKAPVKSSPTNQHQVFLQAGCPSCRPANSVKALKGKYHIPWTCLPKLSWPGMRLFAFHDPSPPLAWYSTRRSTDYCARQDKTSSPGGLPTLSLATSSSWLPWGGFPCLSSALWCQYLYCQYCPSVTEYYVLCHLRCSVNV